MPVYHFTFHAYRSWNTDHPSGWIQHGKPQIQPPTKALAIHRDRLGKFPEVRFTAEQQQQFIEFATDICTRRNWSLYAISADATHVHIVIAWRDEYPMESVRNTTKRILGYLTAKQAGTKGKPWFSEGSDETPVQSRRHLHYLLHEYLPDHYGSFWRAELFQKETSPDEL